MNFKKNFKLVCILLVLSIVIIYLSDSQFPIMTFNKNINLELYREEIFSKLKEESFNIEISENDINNYINSYFKKNKKYEIEIHIDTTNKKIQLNVNYLFIKTTLCFDFNLQYRTSSDKINKQKYLKLEISNVKIGNKKISIFDKIGQFFIFNIIDTYYELPNILDIKKIEFKDKKIEIEISIDTLFIKKSIDTIGSNLDPIVITKKYIKEDIDKYNYLIKFFSTTDISDAEIKKLGFKMISDYRYLELITYISNGDSNFDLLIRDFNKYNKNINLDKFKENKKKYILELENILEKKIIDSLKKDKNMLYKLIYDYIYKTLSNEYKSKKNQLYLCDTNEIIDFDFIKNKYNLKLSGWDIFSTNKLIILGKQIDSKYILYTDYTNYKIYEDREAALSFLKEFN